MSGKTTARALAAPREAPSARTWRMYRSLVGVGVLSGLVIVTVFEITAPVIASNRAEALREAVFEVVPGASHRVTYAWNDAGGFVPAAPELDGGPRIEAAYDDAGVLVGAAISASSMGYADVIRVLYGYSFAAEAVVGFRVLETRETPGLGDRIITDDAFRAQFDHLDVSLDPTGRKLADPIVAVDPGTAAAPGEVDTITGATISSVAVVEMIGRSAAGWVPRLVARRGQLENGGPVSGNANPDKTGDGG